MIYELPITKEKFEEIQSFEKGNRTHVLFRLREGRDSNVLFLLVHGDKNGMVDISGRLFSLEELLKALLEKKVIKERGIDTIYTISCYGGYQKPVTIDGITIGSLHDSKLPIHAKSFVSIDDDFVLEIVIDDVETA